MKVVYVSGGKDRTMTIPWGLELCGPEGRTTATCKGPADPAFAGHA
jgi:hypothetical protein